MQFFGTPQPTHGRPASVPAVAAVPTPRRQHDAHRSRAGHRRRSPARRRLAHAGQPHRRRTGRRRTPVGRVVGRALGLAPVVLRRRLEATLGIGPRALLSGRQLARLRERLLAGDDVTDALYAAGYGSSSRLYERAQEALGMTPGAYRRGGVGVTIGWTTASTPLGLVLVATTATRRLCRLSRRLGGAACGRRSRPNSHARPSSLASAAPNGSPLPWPWPVARPARTCRSTCRARRFNSASGWPCEPFRAGKPGPTPQLAAMIGQPTAVRAAARACATNKVSLLVPCHRVVGSDASLTGYRWGVERKRRLLELERRRLGERHYHLGDGCGTARRSMPPATLGARARVCLASFHPPGKPSRR